MATNVPITGSIRPIPQQPALGAIARALASAHQFASRPFGYSNPPGEMLSELIGIPALQRTTEDLSYGFPITTGAGGLGGTTRLKPDTIESAMTVAPLAQLAGKGAVKSAKALENATVGATQRARIRSAAAKVPEDTAYEPLRQRMEERGNLAYAVKPKGGNWLAGHTDYALAPLRRSNAPILSGDIVNQAAGRDLFSEYRKVYDQDPTIGLHDWMRTTHPDIYAKIQNPEDRAINRWIDTKLDKYIRNEMGTPEDPVRALAERDILHVSPTELNYRLQAHGKYPTETQQFLAQSDAAKVWEGASDNAINVAKAEDYLKYMGDAEYDRTIKQNPWLMKVPPETRIYGTAEAETLVDDLGFNHLIDELKDAMNPATTLPRNLRLDPKDVDKITMAQAVERVAKINAWRAEEAARAEKAGMLENLKATPRMADDSLQLSFVDKPGGAWVDIPETVDEKGMKLCNSIGKAGGWCTQAEWAAKSYGSGENRLTALVDTEGRPHAQAKITTSKPDAEGTELGNYLNEEEAIGDQFYRNIATVLAQRGVNNAQDIAESIAFGSTRDLPENVRAMLPEVQAEAERMLPVKQLPIPDITELKPVGNSFKSERAQEYAKRDPEYFRKIENSVLKFLNSGEWGNVADLHHYGIVDLQRDPVMLLSYLRDITKQDSRGAQALFNQAIDRNPNAPRFMTARQLREFVESAGDVPGFAGGGLVKGLGELVQKYVAKEAPQAAAEALVKDAPKEQRMLQGFYRGYAGENKPAQTAVGNETYFVSPQRKVGDYYAKRRAAETGEDPHLEMILADPFLLRNNPYGLGIPVDKYNRDFLVTRARRVDPDEVKSRTKLYAEGGAVNFDPDEIAQMAGKFTDQFTPGYAAGGLVKYDPAEIDTIVSEMKEAFHG